MLILRVTTWGASFASEYLDEDLLYDLRESLLLLLLLNLPSDLDLKLVLILFLLALLSFLSSLFLKAVYTLDDK
jgi:hypothetical protein